MNLAEATAALSKKESEKSAVQEEIDKLMVRGFSQILFASVKIKMLAARCFII